MFYRSTDVIISAASLEGAWITISQTAARHKKVEQSYRLAAIDVALIMPALFLCAQRRRGVEEEGGERDRERERKAYR